MRRVAVILSSIFYLLTPGLHGQTPTRGPRIATVSNTSPTLGQLAATAVTFVDAGGNLDSDALNFNYNRIPSLLTLGGNIALPATAADSNAGVVLQGGFRFLHSFGVFNTFLGRVAGNFTMSGIENVGIGFASLQSNVGGQNNVGVGDTTLFSTLNGGENSAIGHQALYNNTDGSFNSAVGYQALLGNIGNSFNTAMGAQALQSNTTGGNNTALGYNSGSVNTTGSNNLFLGYGADSLSNNLSNATAIGHNSVVSASNTIQLGDTNVTTIQTSGNLVELNETASRCARFDAGKALVAAAADCAAGGGVNSVSGTANQIDSTGGATPVLSIANPVTLPGSATITGLISSYNGLTTAGLGIPVQVGVVRAVSQVAAIGTTTIFTVGASNALFDAKFALNCDTTSAASTVNVTLGWTDPASQAQTMTLGSAVVCTALGSGSIGSLSVNFSAKAATTITYSTAIVNTPTYDIRGALYQDTTN